MLTIEPARARLASSARAGPGRLGIALAGGGPLGAFYELGALHALGEAIVGRELTAFDVYVGVSSGSLVAAGLANGFDTTTLGSTFVQDRSTSMPFSPGALLRPATSEYLDRLARFPPVLAHIVRQYLRDPLHAQWAWAVAGLGPLVPAALFDNVGLERFLHTAFATAGHTDDFRRLRPRLYVVATDLDSGTSVVFGDRRHARVPISRAVTASAALPGLYPPVKIGGRHYVDGALIRTVHASLALEGGCRLVICINPLVPFDAAGARGARPTRLAERGLPAILGQTFRALIHSRMQVGMASYRTRFPRSDILLLEPDRRDETLFFSNVFRYAGRRRLTEHAYQQTRRDLLAAAPRLGPILARHGLALDQQRLRDPKRRFATAAHERDLEARHVTRRLERTLGRLERALEARERAG